MNRQDYQKSIINSLTWLSTQVSVSNKLNLTDINVHSENFYRDLLNLAFGYNLQNINIIEPNSAAIDLGDSNARIAIQVTSTSSLSKTRHTVEKFIEKTLFKNYDRLIILNIVEKTAHKISSVGDDSYCLDTKKDIWDVGDLAVMINDLPLEKIEEVSVFLNKQLYVKPSESLPRNIETILRLIELISDEEHPAVGTGFLDEPFPDEKINQRFSEHANFLKQEFLNLYQDYGAVLDSVEQESDIGPVKIRRLAQHLRIYSDKILTECNGDPRRAFAQLIENFINMLNENGFEADSGAAQFFVIKHLIKCNVFPNKEVIRYV
ncbi:SMEK domain-containing protein [Pseudoalteromonas sp. 2CM37A]|uniref:SMEK domain-containing protein n=1 Tax=Pseudoalteromonas sp. 2CM37A TaxID=2929853 RepID=UPI0020BEC111|nr:SMEK domain-containing protein [Pseudoalteromonas sp. 2CM37A]MCK8118635.1 SMEK domain-containing protein [Pseudoalteromonas sp. 2CM37A]